MLSERIEKWSQELRAEGIVEGIAKGEAKGKAEGKMEVFIRLYEKKFASLPQDIRARLMSSDANAIESLIESLMFAANPEDVFKSLN